MDSRGARAARGIAAASVSTLIAAFSHAAGGGSFPSPALLAVVFAFATLSCIALTGRRMSHPRVLAAVLISQAMFHAAFSLPQGSASLTGAVEHQHHGVGAVAMTTPMAGHTTGWMLVAHLLAALVTAGALAWGERAFWGLLDSARLALSALVRTLEVAVVDRDPDAAPLGAGAPVPASALLISSVRRRGPPVRGLLPI